MTSLYLSRILARGSAVETEAPLWPRGETLES